MENLFLAGAIVLATMILGGAMIVAIDTIRYILEYVPRLWRWLFGFAALWLLMYALLELI